MSVMSSRRTRRARIVKRHVDEYVSTLDISEYFVEKQAKVGEGYTFGTTILEPGYRCDFSLYKNGALPDVWGTITLVIPKSPNTRILKTEWLSVSITQHDDGAGFPGQAFSFKIPSQASSETRLPEITIKRPIKQYCFFTVTVQCFDVCNDLYDDDSHPPVKRFLYESMDDADPFVDTKFFVFSRRRNGRVDRPKAVLANSRSLIQADADYFSGLLGESGFRKAKTSPLDSSFPVNEDDYTDDYDYLSDSDLDLDEDHEDAAVGDKAPSQMTRASTAQPEEGGSIQGEEYHASRMGLEGRVVTIKDCAYTTWRALIYYIYTGEVTFAPLSHDGGQDDTRAKFVAQFIKENPFRPLPCSSKSMYRLADKIGMPALKTLAFEDLKQKITVSNILHEGFLTFPTRYPELWEFVVDVLKQNIRDLDMDILVPRIAHSIIENADRGAEIIHSLFDAMRNSLIPVGPPSLRSR